MSRTWSPNPSDSRLCGLLLMALRLVVLVWILAGLLSAQFGSTHHLLSGWFWAGLVVLMGTTAALEWRERGHVSRESALELAIAEQTADLEGGRRREQDRVRILEMVSNRPLSAVLEAILRHLESECRDVACIVAERSGDGCRTLSAVNAPPEWLAALQHPGGPPFEVWRDAVICVNLQESPAWRPFVSSAQNGIPGSAVCRPIRCRYGQSAALVLLYPKDRLPGPHDIRSAEIAERLARVAIEQSRLYESLHHQAHHDSLTGLPNRLLFEEKLESFIHDAAAPGNRMAILFVDLDLFKKVNDTFSHRVGDLFLREIACRMRNTIRPTDVVARIGGDEFTILIRELKEPAEASEVADRLLESIRQPVQIEDREITSSASVGIAIYPEDGCDAETLQRAADAAMYIAKDSGRDRAEAFSARGELLDKLRIEEELRVALRDGSFVVHYQPKVRADLSPAGFEALIRLDHPIWGQLPPMTFIPEAESSGLIVPIGFWVLDEVCRQIAEWEARGLDPISVAVNVSPVQMCRGNFARSVADCLQRRGVDPSRLEIEITESLMIDADGATQEQLKALRALGVRLSIDDFGTGYSSLSYLHKLPIDAIKLDKSFVQSVDSDHLAHRLVHAMIGVAEGLGLDVVAEGVETEEQRKVLVDAGCGLMQGFLFSKPHPAGELKDFLQPRHRDASVAMTRDLVVLSAVTVTDDLAAGASEPP
jgi:diguanylate cyclase (GGDEF)-like protein